MNNQYTEGQRYEFTPVDFEAIINMSGSALTPIITGAPDYSRGRLFEKAPGDWAWWNTDGKKITASVSSDGVFISASTEADPKRPEPLEQEAA